MAVQLNHTIVAASERERSAAFVAEILGLGPPGHYGPFTTLDTANGVSLDFMDVEGAIATQHYAFLVDEPDFDVILERIRQGGLEHWADPMKVRPKEINRNDGGRGVYFHDPDGHMLEIITRPYGSGG